jgi:hypothetical protein
VSQDTKLPVAVTAAAAGCGALMFMGILVILLLLLVLLASWVIGTDLFDWYGRALGSPILSANIRLLQAVGHPAPALAIAGLVYWFVTWAIPYVRSLIVQRASARVTGFSI